MVWLGLHGETIYLTWLISVPPTQSQILFFRSNFFDVLAIIRNINGNCFRLVRESGDLPSNPIHLAHSVKLINYVLSVCMHYWLKLMTYERHHILQFATTIKPQLNRKTHDSSRIRPNRLGKFYNKENWFRPRFNTNNLLPLMFGSKKSIFFHLSRYIQSVLVTSVV